MLPVRGVLLRRRRTAEEAFHAGGLLGVDRVNYGIGARLIAERETRQDNDLPISVIIA